MSLSNLAWPSAVVKVDTFRYILVARALFNKRLPYNYIFPPCSNQFTRSIWLLWINSLVANLLKILGQRRSEGQGFWWLRARITCQDLYSRQSTASFHTWMAYTNHFHSLSFDLAHQKVGDVLHKFGTFSKTPTTRVEHVMIILWVVGIWIIQYAKVNEE